MLKTKQPLKPVLLAFALKLFDSVEGIAGSVFKQIYRSKDIADVYLRHLRVLNGLVRNTFAQSYNLRRIAVVILISFGLAATYLLTATPLTAQAATDSTINFQARLETSAGAIVPDGSYNVTFHLFNASSSAGSTDTSCSIDANCLWEESYTYNSGSGGSDARVHVANGYLTVNLGSITAFPSTINWDQQLWLTMDIGGTVGSGTITWDGQMSPRLQLTAVPYAFRAGQLAQYNSSTGYTSTLGLTSPTGGNQSFVLPDMAAAGTYTLMTTTTGVQLQATTPGTAQTGYFNISGTGIAGTLEANTFDTPTAESLNIGTGNATWINLGQSASFYTGANRTLSVGTATSGAGNSLTIHAGNGASGSNNGGDLVLQGGAATGTGTGGSVIVKPQTDSISAFQIQNASGTSNLLLADTADNCIGIGAACGAKNAILYVTDSSTGDGVLGYNSATGGTGLYGENDTSTGNGVYGYNSSGTGVFGDSNGSSGYGVSGYNGSASGGIGVYGESDSSAGIAVKGYSQNGTGVLGYSSAGIGLQGSSGSWYSGYFTAGSSSNTNTTLVVQQAGSSTANLLQVLTSGSSPLFTIASTGATTIESASNSTSAFQVQNASAAAVLDVDTTNGRVGIGTTTPDQVLQVNGAADISGGGAVPASGISGLGLGYNSGNYAWIQSYGSTPLLLNPLNNSVGIDTTTTGARLQINTNGTADIGQIIQGTGGQTADLFQAQNSSGSTLFDITAGGAAQQTGFATTNTSSGTNWWTELGSCTLTSQYSECLTTFNIIGGLSGNSNVDVANVTARVKQQGALGSTSTGSLYVEVSLGNHMEFLNNSDFEAVITQYTTGGTVVQLWGDIGQKYDTWNVAPTVNSDTQWVWTPTSGLSASYPTGQTTGLPTDIASPIINAVYGDSYANTLTVQTLGGNSTSALEVQNASAGTIFSVDTTNNRVVVGSGVTGALLVLGGGTSDPTSVDGAMYYNTSGDSFRCSHNGYWSDCSGLVQSYTTTAGPEGGTAEHSFGQTWTAPHNDCEPGTVYHLIAGGWAVSNTGGYTLYFNLQDTNVATSTTTDIRTESVKIGTNSTWTLNLYITCTSTTNIVLSGNVYSEYSGGNTSVFHTPSTGYSISNGASGDQYGLSVQWSNGPGSGNGAYEQTFIMQRMGTP